MIMGFGRGIILVVAVAVAWFGGARFPHDDDLAVCFINSRVVVSLFGL